MGIILPAVQSFCCIGRFGRLLQAVGSWRSLPLPCYFVFCYYYTTCGKAVQPASGLSRVCWERFFILRRASRNVQVGHSCFSVQLNCQQIMVYRYVAPPMGQMENGYCHNRQTVVSDCQPVFLRFAPVGAPNPVGPLYQRVPPQPVMLLFRVFRRRTAVLLPTCPDLGGQFVPVSGFCL